MATLLSKSDFRAASSCITKLYYRKRRYPSEADTDEYLELLQDGGYMIDELAKLLFPDGQRMPNREDPSLAAQETMAALAGDRVTLFEATLVSGGKLARTDILVKDGDTIALWEVKSSGVKGSELADGSPFRGAKGGILSDARETLEDLAFQMVVLRELFPRAELHGGFIMPDKERATSIEGLHAMVHIMREPVDGGRYHTIRVDFDGDPVAWRRDHFLAFIPADDEVAELIDDVAARAAGFVTTLDGWVQRVQRPIDRACAKCEYRTDVEQTPSGFDECWGELAKPVPHLLELYKVGSVGPRTDPYPNQLIRAGRTSLFDVDAAMLRTAKNEIGADARRQLTQLQVARSGREWIDPALRDVIVNTGYPLHFIDFETSSLAVPYHRGMRAWQLVAFQWSVHTIRAPGAPIEHDEWLNLEESYPNVEFASTLRTRLGDDGTVFMWSHHERTVLRAILRELLETHGDVALAEWLASRVGEAAERPFVDMNRLCLLHYCHPAMKGRTSIKPVLNAIWQDDAAVRALFPGYVKEREGHLLSPYDSLDAIEVAGKVGVVREGTGAVRAYQDLLYGESRGNADAKARYGAVLRQYCRLDTAAMVIVWEHWRNALGMSTHR